MDAENLIASRDRHRGRRVRAVRAVPRRKRCKAATMTAIHWGQLALYTVLLAARSRSRSGSTWPRSTKAGAPGCTRSSARSRSAIYRVARHRRGRRAGLEALPARAARLQPRSASCCSTCILRAAGRPAAEPAGLARREAEPRLQHRRQLHDEHELAVVRRRDDDELPLADGRAHLPELRLGRRRHGRPRRADPRPRAPLRRRPSATSGSTSRAARSTSSCRSRSSSRSSWSRRASSRTSTPTRRSRRSRASTQIIAHGAGRLADRDQAARHERRRLLQRELRAPVREPDAVVEPRRDAGDPPDPGRPRLHVRQDGRLDAARLGRCSA